MNHEHVRLEIHAEGLMRVAGEGSHCKGHSWPWQCFLIENQYSKWESALTGHD